jgi:hypothetical protein
MNRYRHCRQPTVRITVTYNTPETCRGYLHVSVVVEGCTSISPFCRHPCPFAKGSPPGTNVTNQNFKNGIMSAELNSARFEQGSHHHHDRLDGRGPFVCLRWRDQWY